MKLQEIVAVMTGFAISANAASLIINGDFESDGYVDTGNSVVASVTGWTGPISEGRLRYDSSDNQTPEALNTVIRLMPHTSIYQVFSASWGTDDTISISFNACEVWWKADPMTELGNGVWVSLRNATTGDEYLARLTELDGSHGGIGSTYATWQPDQTFSIDFSGADLIDVGAIANEDLRVNFYSKANSNSINWLDNVSVVVPEPSSAALMALGALGLLLRLRPRSGDQFFLH